MGIPKWPPCPNIMTYMHIHTAHTHTHVHMVHTYIHVYMIHIKVSVFSVYLSVCVYIYVYFHVYCVCVYLYIHTYFKNTGYLLVKVALLFSLENFPKLCRFKGSPCLPAPFVSPRHLGTLALAAGQGTSYNCSRAY